MVGGRCGNDVVDSHLEKAVAIEIADDKMGDLPFARLQFGVGELPLQVRGEARFLGDKIELRRCICRRSFLGEGKVGVKIVGIFGPVGFRQVVVGSDPLGKIAFLARPGLFEGVGEPLGKFPCVEGTDVFLKRRVLLDLCLQRLGKLQSVQLEQLDGLTQLRRHHQFLYKLELLSEFQSHNNLHVKIFAKIHLSGDFAFDDVVGDTAGEDLA